MNIIITNDDGYQSYGIIALQKALSMLGNVIILAPENDVTGTSQAINLKKPLEVTQRDQLVYSVKGYPTDCTGLAIHSPLLHDITNNKIDLILSGINQGVNMGNDVWYSGTVAGARHAFIHGYSAIALSCGYDFDHENSPEVYDRVAQFTKNFITSIIPKLEPPFLLNINHPNSQHTNSIKWTHLGQRTYVDIYHQRESLDEKIIYAFNSDLKADTSISGTDFHAYHENHISITPLHTDVTHYDKLNAWSTLTL